MLETNLKILTEGMSIRVPVRYANLEAAHLSSEIAQRTCNLLGSRYQLAARPVPGSENQLVVLSNTRIPSLRVEEENVTVTVDDLGREGAELQLNDELGKAVLPSLLERALIAGLPHATNLWRLDSPRKWLERDPFSTRDGIEAYRRFEISGLLLESVGLAMSVDISTAFLASQTLDYYHATGIPTEETKRRQEAFTRLTSRQKGQKGTLVYRVGLTTRVCYFEKANPGQTCGLTPEIKVKGLTYRNLQEYYLQRYPEAKIKDNEPAVLVSFQGLDVPVWVAARLLRIRVMNESLPDSLTSVDKIAPLPRVRLIDRFWQLVGDEPFGISGLTVSQGYYRPHRDRIVCVALPRLEFANGRILEPPAQRDAAEYKKHYRSRTELLDSAGVYSLPPATNRTIQCAYPKDIPTEAAKQLAGDVGRAISKWTKLDFRANLVPYASLTDATARLRSASSTVTVLFVLDENPADYYDSAFQLQGWRLKRVTRASFRKHYKYLEEGAWDRKKEAMDLRRGGQKWDQYVHMIGLDVLQQMDGIPYRVRSLGAFESQLAIDVGYDRRHIAISLLVARDPARNPNFRIATEVHAKTDHKLETINPTILSDMVLQMFNRLFRGKFDPLQSLLVTRDGEFRGQERTGIYQTLLQLKDKGFLALDAATALAELHKTSQKSVRLWERVSDEDVRNPLECHAVILSPNLATLVTTGEATLHQGTAEPMTLVCDGDGESLRRAVEATAIGAQLNWASPGVAQRLPVVFKRTDEELEVRYSQEIRRIA
jgi:hypothetical protein